MRKFQLLAGCASATLLIAAGSNIGHAQTIEIGTTGQSAHNSSVVTQAADISTGNVTGAGASVGSSAIGASSSVQGTFINSSANITAGDITQSATQSATYTADPLPEVGNLGTVTVGDISGAGAAVQKSATGAQTSVTARYINAGGNVTIGSVKQTATNNPLRQIETFGPIFAAGGSTGDIRLTGDGVSLSISATGAAAIISALGIGSYSGLSLNDVSIGSISQNVSNSGMVLNNDGSIAGYTNFGLTRVTGDGASASISATGAQAVISVSRIGTAAGNPNTSIANGDEQSITQNAYHDSTASIFNYGSFYNRFDGRGGLTANISGAGASISSSAAGAISALSITSIGTAGQDSIDIATSGSINQTATVKSSTDAPTYIANYASIATNNRPNITGNGASISTSATGAATSISVTSINSSPVRYATFGTISQDAYSDANLFNENFGEVFRTAIGNISGHGASVSFSAAGAVAAVSFRSIGNNDNGRTPRINTNTINQRAINDGNVVNFTRNLSIGNLSGAGTSASISSSGATAQVSSASISDSIVPSLSVNGGINQTAINYGLIVNLGSITVGNITGAGSSVSVSAVGTAASISTVAINSAQISNISIAPTITQTVVNAGRVKNIGTITAGAVRGAGASISASAVGASASVSGGVIN